VPSIILKLFVARLHVQKYCYSSLCGIEPVVAYCIKIDINTATNNDKLLLLLSINCTCFSHADLPQVLKALL